MDPRTSASDSDNVASKPSAKGLAQIALGAAAGAFLASRMNRGALLLTAGLAYSLWKKGHESPVKSSETSEEPAFTDAVGEPSSENGRTEEALTEPVLLAKAEEPESSSLDSSVIRIVPAIEPVIAPPHIAPFLTFPVIEEPTPQIHPEVESDSESKPQVFDLGSAKPESVETIEKESKSQESSAWEELRAALTPTYPSAPARTDLDVEATKPQIVTEAPQPQIPASESVTFSEPPAALEAPPMIDLTVCQPSSPLIHTPITEGVDIPDEIQLPEVSEENAITTEDFLLDPPKAPEPSEGVNTPTKPITVIIPRQDIKFTAALTPPAPLPDETAPNSLSAPVVIPRDVQAKKSFFDWLRG